MSTKVMVMSIQCERRLARKVLALLVILSICLSLGLSVASAVSSDTKEGVKLVDRFKEKNTEIRGDNIEVSLLLRAIGRQAGVNVVVDESIEDTVTLDLGDMSLYDVFHLIMETKDLSYYESNNAILVENKEDFIQDQRDVIMTRLCARFGDVSNHLKELEVLKSDIGNITVSSDGNCLVVRDHENNVARIKELLAELDEPQPQVHIKARIVIMAKSVSKQLGIKWGYTDTSNAPDTFSAAVDLGIADPTTSVVFGFIRDTFSLDLELSAMQEKEELFTLSSPRIVVLDGEEAEIKQGKEIPYESGTRENRNTSFREAVLSLNVVPKILQDRFIRLGLKVTNDSVDKDETNEDDQPLINRQEIKTNLFLEDGVTVVVGGILAKENDFQNEEVPFLADIPWIGELFKNRGEIDETYELLVFLTPTIIREQHGFFSQETMRNGGGRIEEKKLISVPVLPEQYEGEQPTSESEVLEKVKAIENASESAKIPDVTDAGGLVISPIQVKDKRIEKP